MTNASFQLVNSSAFPFQFFKTWMLLSSFPTFSLLHNRICHKPHETEGKSYETFSFFSSASSLASSHRPTTSAKSMATCTESREKILILKQPTKLKLHHFSCVNAKIELKNLFPIVKSASCEGDERLPEIAMHTNDDDQLDEGRSTQENLELF